jgi:hypothetical protein
VPADNAIEVLRASAIAAKASFTDVGTGAKAANLLLDAFGVTIDQLPTALDKIVKSGHDGGLTLKEFADSAGPLLNVAKAAGIGFDDLVATLTVLADKEGNAGQATTDLTKIIQKLDTSEARQKLRALGIEGDTLVEHLHAAGAEGSRPQRDPRPGRGQHEVGRGHRSAHPERARARAGARGHARRGRHGSRVGREALRHGRRTKRAAQGGVRRVEAPGRRGDWLERPGLRSSARESSTRGT